MKAGVTCADLLKVFTTEGGLSTGLTRTYIYRGLPIHQGELWSLRRWGGQSYPKFLIEHPWPLYLVMLVTFYGGLYPSPQVRSQGFSSSGGEATYTFNKDGKGQVTEMVYDVGIFKLTAKKIK